jgi:hypothetical protein
MTGATSDLLNATVEMILDAFSLQIEDGPSNSECASTNNNTFGCNDVGAASCSLYPWIQTYNATIENGDLKEQVVSAWIESGMNGDTLTGTWNAASVACLPKTEKVL